MSLMDTVKAHPVAAGGVAIAVFVVVLVIANSGGVSQNASTATDTGASQMDQINAQLAAAQYSADSQRQINADNNATAIALATIDQQNKAGEYAVQTAQIGAAQQVATLQSTLSARVQEAGIGADVQKQQIQTSGSVETTRIYANALTSMAQINSSTALGIAQANNDHGSILGGLISW